MLPYKGKAGEIRLKSLRDTLTANNTCKIFNTGTKLASKMILAKNTNMT